VEDVPRAGAEGAVVVCQDCGDVRPFRRLPLLLVTGPSGAGKSTAAALLASRLSERVVVLDQDLLWIPELQDASGEHRLFRRTWLRMVAAISQNGRPVLLCGTVVPGQFEASTERALVADMHYLALVCEDEELAARLRARPPWRGWTEERIASMVNFNRWIKRSAAETDPPMSLLDTTEASVDDTAAHIAGWAMNALAAAAA
jgi:broad-specificity NMP kinase